MNFYMEKITIYTDGACSGNPGPGGFGCILLETEKKVKKEISQEIEHLKNDKWAYPKAMELYRDIFGES